MATQPRILVVDDDESLRRMLAASLLRAGMLVECVATAAAARERLGDPPPIDAVLLDGVLPDCRGVDLARDLIDGGFPTIPICFLTGAVHVAPATAAGIACVAKPASPTDVAAAVNALLAAPPAVDPVARAAALDRFEAALLF